jgi:DNA-binding PadR family transcriptional regulator
MTEAFKRQVVLRFSRNFLDILILRLVQVEPMWGYKIIKKTEALFGIKLRHGAIYPLLNSLEADGFLKSKQEIHGKRKRKVYEVTPKGKQFVITYYGFLREQLLLQDLKG